MMKSRPVCYLLIVLTMILAAASASSFAETVVTVRFDAEQCVFDRVRGYDRVVLADGSMMCHPGEPTLPAQRILVALPQGTEATALKARSLASQEFSGEYVIFPGQPPARLDGGPQPAFVHPVADIYRSAAAYPGPLATLEGQTDLVGQQMAVVTVYPLQYVPATGQLTLHGEMEISVQTRPGRASREKHAILTEKQRQTYLELIQGMVINPQDVILDALSGEASKSLPPGQFDHLIITSSSYASYFDDLVQWHNRRGLPDTVVTTDYIYANYSGSDDPEKIRSFVIDAQSSWGTMYFLMGGEENVVPFEYRNYDGAPDDTPSDQYYADYDDDWTCEVFVGRISGSDQDQFDTAIDKILTYEKDPPLTNYPLDILLVGMDLDEYTPSQNLKETIDGYIPSRFDVTKVYDSHSGNHKDSTIAALDDGQNLFNHSDHANSIQLGLGYFNHGWFLGKYAVSQLANENRTTNIVSTGCWANDITYGGIQDGIAEAFVIYNDQHAGLSFTGNTRDGWFYSGSLNTLTSLVDREWWKSLFTYDKYVLGQTLADGKNRNIPNTNLWRHCVWTFNLLGEPAMPLWTDTPASVTVTHPATLPLGSSTFAVHVASGGSGLPSAYVCLWKKGEVYLRQSTNSSGDATFSPNPATAGSLYVTVTKKNYLPYEGQALATGEPPPAVDDVIIELAQGDIVLGWSPPTSKAIVRYVVYRDTSSDFQPEPEDSIGETSDTVYTDMGAAGLVGTNYYYIIKAVDEVGQKSDPSGIVGEFDVELITLPK